MAKSVKGSAAKRTSKSKKSYTGKPKRKVSQNPPIIIKGGAQPPEDDIAEDLAMEMLAEEPMDFSYSPEVVNASRYSYPKALIGEVMSITVRKDGKIVCDQSVAGSDWEISILAG